MATMTHVEAELARVTCEEFYTEPAYGMDPDLDTEEPECHHCGDYGYLGVEDELCTACDGPKTTWAISADLFEGWDEIPF